jgi:hypothetical protein
MSQQIELPLDDLPKWKVVNRDGTKPWTQEEVERMFRMVAKKRTNQQIAGALGRSAYSVAAKLYNLKELGVNYTRDLSGFALKIIQDASSIKATKAKLKCLCCRKMFDSKDVKKNRVCSDCKQSETWR